MNGWSEEQFEDADPEFINTIIQLMLEEQDRLAEANHQEKSILLT